MQELTRPQKRCIRDRSHAEAIREAVHVAEVSEASKATCSMKCHYRNEVGGHEEYQVVKRNIIL